MTVGELRRLLQGVEDEAELFVTPAPFTEEAPPDGTVALVFDDNFDLTAVLYL